MLLLQQGYRTNGNRPMPGYCGDVARKVAVAVYEELDQVAILPVTAYEVREPH